MDTHGCQLKRVLGLSHRLVQTRSKQAQKGVHEIRWSGSRYALTVNKVLPSWSLATTARQLGRYKDGNTFDYSSTLTLLIDSVESESEPDMKR